MNMDDRTAFRQSMETQLHQLEADLEDWEAAEDRSSDAAQRRREQQQTLDDLHEKRLQARQYLDQVARRPDWQTLKPKVERLWTEMKTQIDALKARA